MTTSSSSVIELILQLKDLATAGLERFRSSVEKVQGTTQSWQQNMSSLNGRFGDFTGKIQGIGDIVASQASPFGKLTGIIGGLGAALAAVGFVKWVDEAVDASQELGSHVLQLQRITGMTAESASQLIAVGDHVGVSFDTLQSAVQNVERRMGGLKGIEDQVVDSSGKTVDIFEKFGITIKNSDGTVRSFSDVFNQIRGRIQAAGSATEQMAMATQFFRGNAAALIPLLTMSDEQYKEITEDARKYGLILSQDNVDSIRQYTLAHKDMDDAMQGVKVALGSQLMPALTDFAKWLAENISDVKDFASGLGTVLGAAIKIVIGLFQGAAGTAMVLASGLMKIGAGMLYATGQFKTGKEVLQSSNNMFAAGQELMGKGIQTWVSIGDSSAAAGKKIANAAASHKTAAASIAEDSDIIIAQKKAELQTFQAVTDLQIAELDQQYKEGKITVDDFYRWKEALQQQASDKELTVAQATLEELNKNPDKNKQKIIEVQAQIDQLMIKAAQTNLQTEQQYTEALEQEHDKQYKSFEDTKKQEEKVLQSYNELMMALDEAAVKAGELTQADALQRKLDRDKEFGQKLIEDAQAVAEQAAATYGLDSQQFIDAIARKEEAQNNYQRMIIDSESAIAAEKKKSLDQQLQQSMQSHATNLIDVEQTYQRELALLAQLSAAKAVIEEEYEAKRKAIEEKRAQDVQNIIQQQQDSFVQATARALQFIHDAVDNIRSTLGNLTQDTDWTDVKQSFRDVATALSETYQSMAADMDRFTSSVWNRVKNELSPYFMDSMNQLFLYGKNVTAMSADQVQEWANRVTTYVQKVQDLFQSLKEQISSWQDELDRMKGNETAIVQRWYDSELAALKQKYGEELQSTKEYQDALLTLKELYNEKMKKALEDEARASADAQSGMISKVASMAKTVADNVKANARDIAGSLKDIGFDSSMTGAVTKNVRLDSTFKIQTFDAAATKRWANDVLFPMWEKYLELQGRKI